MNAPTALALVAVAARSWLCYRVALQVIDDRRFARLAAVLAAASPALWSWSLEDPRSSLAAALVPAAVLVALRRPRPTPEAALVLGLMTGLGAGAQGGCLVLAALVATDVLSSRIPPRERFRILALYLYALFIGGALVDPARILRSAWASWRLDLLPMHWELWLAAPLCTDLPLPWLGALHAAFAWTMRRDPRAAPIQKRALRMGGVILLGVPALLILGDPGSRFAGAASVLFPVLLCSVAATRRWPAWLAAAAWTALVVCASQDPEAWLRRAELGKSVDQRVLARQSLADAQRRAQRYQELGQCPRALPILRRLIGRQPGSASLRSDEGLCEYLVGDRRAAEEDLRKAIALDPAFLPATLNLGFIYVRQGRAREAEELYRRALAAGLPGDPLLKPVREGRDALRVKPLVSGFELLEFK